MENQLNYLNAMGIQAWQLKNKQSSLAINEVNNDSNNWQTLKMSVSGCTACELHKTRTQTVFGVGNQNADLMIIGEAPGFYEDQKGEPFVGRAGQLLDAMLQAIGLDRNSVYIANILKCRPPNNRDPQPEESACCTPFLEKQIALIKPKLLLALGRIAGQYLLATSTSIGQLRGKVYKYQDIPLIVTYHPAYLLRTPSDKAKAFKDLQLTLQQLSHPANS